MRTYRVHVYAYVYAYCIPEATRYQRSWSGTTIRRADSVVYHRYS